MAASSRVPIYRVMIYASKLSSFVNMHPYVPMGKTWMEVLSGIEGGAILLDMDRRYKARVEAASIGTAPMVDTSILHEPKVLEERISEAVSKIDLKLNLSQQCDDMLSSATDDTLSIVRMKLGERLEAPVVESLSLTASNDKFYKKKIEFDGHTVWLGGKIDGLDAEGNIYEIKNRAKRIPYRIPDYDLIQVGAYMRLLGKSQAFVHEVVMTDRSKTRTTRIVGVSGAKEDVSVSGAKEYLPSDTPGLDISTIWRRCMDGLKYFFPRFYEMLLSEEFQDKMYDAFMREEWDKMMDIVGCM
jgi:hypothetical protein